MESLKGFFFNFIFIYKIFPNRSNFSEDLKAGKVIRLIYQGRLLRDDKATISSFGLTDQCVLHCHIGTRPYGTTTNNEPIGNENAQNSQGLI